jgi:hypothetical protein
LNGHQEEHYAPLAVEQATPTHICGACDESLSPVLSVGRGLTFIEEGRPYVLRHIGHEPVTVRSWREWDRKVKEAGVEWVGAKYGEKGAWV